MAGLTAAQKTRLGVFLGLAALILVATVVGLFGLAVLEKKDEYVIRFEGSVSGLSAGSTVRYNGIDAGRVTRVHIDPEHVSGVEVRIALEQGTPVRTDTKAVLQMQGITGLKYIELATAGDKDATVVPPGSVIESSRSEFDELTQRATNIAKKLEDLLDNVVDITSGENAKLLTDILTDVNEISSATSKVLTKAEPQIEAILDEAQKSVAALGSLRDDAKHTLGEVDKTLAAARGSVDVAAKWVNPKEVSRAIKRVETTLVAVERASNSLNRTLDTARARMAKNELGQAIASVSSLAARTEKFVGRADVTLVRARDDLLRVLASLVDGAEAFGELAAMLKEDPSALITGKSGKERELP